MKELKSELVVLDTKNLPPVGVFSDLDASALSPGQWAVADNVRIRDKFFEVRGGVSTSIGTIAAGSLRGEWQGYLWGSYTMLRAVDIGAAVAIYRSTDAGANWTELTNASGTYGNTRLSDSANIVRFTVVPDALQYSTTGFAITNTERLIVGNGTDAVRVFRSGPTGAIVGTIAPQQDAQAMPVQVKSVEYYWNLQVANTPTASDTDFAWSTVGTAPNLTHRLTVKTTIDDADNATLTFTSGNNILASDWDRQLLLGLDTAYANFLDNVKIELGGVVVWDPTTPIAYPRPIAVQIDISQKMVWVFNYAKRTSTASGVVALKFTWVGTNAPTADQTVDLFLVGLTYGHYGYSDYQLAVTNYNAETGTESPGVIYSTYSTQRIRDLGGPATNELRLPRSPVLKAVPYAPYRNVTTTERAAGVNYANFYVKQTGSSKYRLWHTEGTSSTSAYTYGSAAGDLTYIQAFNTTAAIIYPEAYVPDEFNIPIPIAAEVSWANNRLMVGVKQGSSLNLMFSESGNAFRMRQFVTFEEGQIQERSGGVLNLGNETIQCIVPVAASSAGASTSLIFTDRSVFATYGSEIRQLMQVGRISSIGTISPLSVVSDKGDTYFLDTDMQLRIIRGSSVTNAITRNVIGENFQGCPVSRRKSIVSAVHNNYLYIFYTPSGGTTNTKAAILDLDRGLWVTDTPPMTVEGAQSFHTGTGTRFFVTGVDGSNIKLYEYDLSTQSQDFGTTDITITLAPYELQLPSANVFHVGRMKIMMSDNDWALTASRRTSNSPFTIKRTYLPTGVYQTTTVDFDAQNNFVYRQDRIEGAPVTPGNERPAGTRCRINITGSLHARDTVQYISFETVDMGPGYDRP